jgi:hypothetical protein
MKINSLTSSLLLVFGFVVPGVADTFTLKDGKTLEGKILRTEGDVYVIEYQYNRSIKDIKKVPKSDVVKITSAKLDDKPFEAIAKLTPTPDMLTADDYKQRLLAVKAFITQFPKSPKLAEAEAIHKKLTEECAVITAGGKKLQGMMISGADYRANAMTLDARVLETKIRDAADKAQWLVVLRTFVDLDKDFQSVASYREVLPVVIKSLQAFRAQVAASLDGFDARAEKQLADIESLPPRDKQNSERALTEQAAELEARYKKEKTALQVWVTPHPAHKQSLEDNSSLAESELQRLTQALAAPAPAADGGKVYRDTWKILHSEATPEEIEKALAAAEAASLPERYLKVLQAEAKAAPVKPAAKP